MASNEAEVAAAMAEEIARLEMESALEASPPPPSSAAELTGGVVSRENLRDVGGGLGAIVGGGTAFAAGLPTGPGAAISGAAGSIAGGALGAAAGSTVYDSLNDFLDFTGAIERGRSPSVIERSIKAAREGLTDAQFAMAVPALGKIVSSGYPLLGRLLGLNSKEVSDLIDKARASGLTLKPDEPSEMRKALEKIPKLGDSLRTTRLAENLDKRMAPAIGVMDVTAGKARSVTNMAVRVGGVFPFIGGPIRQNVQSKTAVAKSRVDDILNKFAPTAITADELGVNMFEAAERSVKGFRESAAEVYDAWRAKAATLGEVVPTDHLRALSESLQREVDLKQVTLKDGTKGTEVKSDLIKMLLPFSKPSTGLKDYESIPALKEILDNLETELAKSPIKSKDQRILNLAKKAIELDLADIGRGLLGKTVDENGKPLSGAAAEAVGMAEDLFRQDMQEVMNLKHAADKYWSEGIVTYQSPVAKKVARVDKNVFGPGPVQLGTMNADELADVVFSLKSKEGIQQIRALMGDDVVSAAGRRHFERAWESVLIFDKTGRNLKAVDWEKFKQKIGLNRDQEGALGEVLKSAGIEIDHLKNLIEVASAIEVTADVSQFLVRGATLGGNVQRTIMRATTGGASVAMMGPVGTTLFTLALRRMGRILSDPKSLSAMRAALDPKTPFTFRAALLARLANAGMDATDTESTDIPEMVKEAPGRSKRLLQQANEFVEKSVSKGINALPELTGD